MTDLTNKKLIYFKGALFLIILLVSAGMIFYDNHTLKTAGLLVVLIWASARLYYFMFYVIEKYVDSNYRFSSIYSFIKYVFSQNASTPKEGD